MNESFHTAQWSKTAYLRRIVLFFLIVVPSIIASSYMAEVLPNKGASALETVLLLFFFFLIAWISVGFWAAMSGFYLYLRRFDRFQPREDPDLALDHKATTAILFPICNENVSRVYAGLYSVYQSLQKTEERELFDFFILSDTKDPDKWIEEEAAWKDLCVRVNGIGRIFYRNRRVSIKKKSGNISDFCRRWGYKYRYMVVMDADSIMSGSTIARMVKTMESRPGIGILQTAPLGINAKTLFARLQQFTTHIYGPFFSAGLHYWLLGNANYWGHNAIIRIEPFIKHCALPKLPGNPPLGGEILSHDFVEAALIRKGGWEVWLAYDYRDSYEEMPPTLLDELKRDRRWCQGNIQHLKILFAEGLCPVHRFLFLAGAMTYISGLLWFLFLMISTAEASFEALVKHTYFPAEHALFPSWPVWNPQCAILLITFTATLLFLPKILSVFFVGLKLRRAGEFGGWIRLMAGVAVEILLSALLAPVRMMFHCKFVLFTLLGKKVTWETQKREETSITWGKAIRFHWTVMTFAFLWGMLVFMINPSFFWWLIPILAALVLSVPITVWTSRSTLGDKFERIGLLRIPVENRSPDELDSIYRYQREYLNEQTTLNIRKEDGFIRAIADPHINALHLDFLQKERRYSPGIFQRKKELQQKALSLGPDGLTPSEKRELLSDPASLVQLHRAVWKLTDDASARMWGIYPAFSLESWLESGGQSIQ